MQILYAIGSVDVPGWASLAATVSFTSGVQLFFLGVLGEYVALIFDEVKDRPLYLLDRQHRRNAGPRRDDADYDQTMIGRSGAVSRSDAFPETPDRSEAEETVDRCRLTAGHALN